jgi:hypothetical protein
VQCLEAGVVLASGSAGLSESWTQCPLPPREGRAHPAGNSPVWEGTRDGAALEGSGGFLTHGG